MRKVIGCSSTSPMEISSFWCLIWSEEPKSANKCLTLWPCNRDSSEMKFSKEPLSTKTYPDFINLLMLFFFCIFYCNDLNLWSNKISKMRLENAAGVSLYEGPPRNVCLSKVTFSKTSDSGFRKFVKAILSFLPHSMKNHVIYHPFNSRYLWGRIKEVYTTPFDS